MSLPTEDECYQDLQEHLSKAVEAAARISFLREDQRWVHIARGLEGTKRMIQALMAKRINDSLGFGGKNER